MTDQPDRPADGRSAREQLALGATDPAVGTGGAGRDVAPLTVGGRLGNRYQVKRLLGQGGMGAVYLALDEVLGKDVALKCVRPELAGGTRGMQQMRDEVLLAQEVTHPSVCRIYDLKEVDGLYLVKMEYIAGETLDHRLEAGAAMPIDEAVAISRSIVAGLAAAHGKGVVHRDLKPQNVMIESGSGRVVLMDFGIARSARARSAEESPSGTPGYMAPEQAKAEAVDGRADLYALGCVLYHMLVGDVPFPASTPMAAMVRHMMDPPPDPRELRPDVPAWLARLVLRLLEKDPGRRFATAADVLHALEGPRRRHLRLLGLAGGLAALALLGIGLTLHRHLSVTTRDCGGYALQQRVMTCVRPLAAGEQRQRAVSFRFHAQRGRVLRVERLRGQGGLIGDDDGHAVWEYGYDDGGRLKETVVRNRRREVQVRWEHGEGALRSDRHDAFGNPQAEEGTDVTTLLEEWDARGFLAGQRFCNMYGSPRPDRSGAYGYRVTTDAQGQIVEEAALGPEGKPSATVEGMSRLRLVRDAQGNLVEEQILGADGKPVRSRQGWATLRLKYGPRGNRVEKAFFDVDGRPVVAAGGYAAARYVFDDRGDNVQVSFFGDDGAPILAEGVAIIRMRHDAQGEKIEESFFGLQGEAVLGQGGFATRRIRRDGALREETFLDAKGQPTLASNGYARLRVTVDERERPVEQASLGVAGQPVQTRDGPGVVRLRYDARGRLIEQSYLGVDGLPTLHRLGYATLRRAYDERGRLIEESYHGPDGKPTAHRDGHAVLRLAYDEAGNPVESEFLDVERRPLRNRMGYARVRRTFDPRGEIIEESFRGPGGEPTPSRDGYATWRGRRDGQGHVVEERFLDAAGKPAILPAGYSGRRLTFDGHGRMVAVHVDGIDRALGGAAGLLLARDARGQVVEERFFDAQGRPSPGPGGVAARRYTLDPRGRRIEEQYLDGAGQPALDRRGCAGRRTKLDSWGRPTEISCLGVDGQPALDGEGVASVRLRHDERGRVVLTTRHGPDGNPTSGRDGVAALRHRHDAWSNVIEERNFDAQLRPVASRAGVAGRQTVFDRDGQVVRWLEFDLAGDALSGFGRGDDGRPFTWSLERGRIVLLGGDLRPVGRPLAGRLEEIVTAHRAAFARARLRSSRGAPSASAGLLVTLAWDCPGVAPGDLLLRVGDRPLERPEDLASLRSLPGARKAMVLRDGHEEAVVLAERATLRVEPEE